MTHRICVVTQSEAFATSAGMRIRYDRFRDGAIGHDVSIVARPIAEVIREPFDHDVYVFCKTFTPMALALAAVLRKAGKVVGQDLFDDYFSQTGDARLQLYRGWLRQMGRLTDFAICTTPRMAEVVAPFLPDRPISVVGDPVLAYDDARVAILSDRKVMRARTDRRLKLAWFGIGDNPFFPVGIEDLTAAPTLHAIGRLRHLGWDVDLTIATNTRALDVAGLERLRLLPVQPTILEWSEAVEEDLLKASDIVLLPVSDQGFSKAKSLNRALTAMEQGCQVLSLNAALYAPLSAFIYRNVDTLHGDIIDGTARIQPSTVPRLTELIRTLADPYANADAFVAATRQPRVGPARSPAVLHGVASTIELHKYVGERGGLSIGTPFSQPAWGYGLRFEVSGGRLEALASPALAASLALPVADGGREVNGQTMVRIETGGLGIDFGPVVTEMRSPNLAAIMTAYPRILSEIAACCRAWLPNHEVLVAENRSDMPAIPGATA